MVKIVKNKLFRTSTSHRLFLTGYFVWLNAAGLFTLLTYFLIYHFPDSTCPPCAACASAASELFSPEKNLSSSGGPTSYFKQCCGSGSGQIRIGLRDPEKNSDPDTTHKSFRKPKSYRRSIKLVQNDLFICFKFFKCLFN